MKILEKRHDDLVSGSEVWFVRPDHIDDVFRVCVTSNAAPVPAGGDRASLVIATDAELSGGALRSLVGSGAVGLDLPPLYAVSVGYPLDAEPPFVVRRNRDLTPSAWPAFEPVMPAMTGASVSMATGGADAYLGFLDEELKPALAEAFPVDPDDATLTGQSFGGLFVVHALLTRPAAFRRYLAGSPSLWWNDRETLRRAAAAVADSPAPRAHVYLCIGELENKARFGRQFGPMLPEAIRSLLPAAMADGDMQGDFFVLEQTLREWKGEDFSVEAHMFPEESHESITGAMLSRGLRRLYGYV
ncbi:alpha/beta hydrolase [Streptomyces varsoviensis]|uniref:alpha/beta hydrolase n=1 Tax=Streptomyces varsoviensis TaxID=67373 RepID=UPI0006892096|nr:alpha/beta hydrolase-fold protein [Streptomyces varsoviensis]